MWTPLTEQTSSCMGAYLNNIYKEVLWRHYTPPMARENNPRIPDHVPPLNPPDATPNRRPRAFFHAPADNTLPPLYTSWTHAFPLRSFIAFVALFLGLRVKPEAGETTNNQQQTFPSKQRKLTIYPYKIL